MSPSIDELRRRVSYDPVTGEFHWLNGRRQGLVAGWICPARSYRILFVGRKPVLAHRAAWALMNGAYPPGFIDHIDGDRTNNSFENLRVGTNAQNLQNQRAARRDNKSGHLGVQRHHTGYRAVLMINGKKLRSKQYADPLEAHAHYVRWKREFHPFGTL